MSKYEKPSFLSKNEKLFITVILIFFNCSSPPKMKQHKILCFMHHTVLTINRKRLIQIKYLGKMILVANKMEQLPTNNYRSVNLHLRSSLLDQGSQQHILRDDLLTSVNLSIQNRVGRRIFSHLGMKTILGVESTI